MSPLASATNSQASPPASPIQPARVWQALGTVVDPEIGLDLVSLGLIYEVEIVDATVRVTFTLTVPGCPMEEVITAGIVHAVMGVRGVEDVLPRLVWEPSWHPGMVREGAW